MSTSGCLHQFVWDLNTLGTPRIPVIRWVAQVTFKRSGGGGSLIGAGHGKMYCVYMVIYLNCWLWLRVSLNTLISRSTWTCQVCCSRDLIQRHIGQGLVTTWHKYVTSIIPTRSLFPNVDCILKTSYNSFGFVLYILTLINFCFVLQSFYQLFIYGGGGAASCPRDFSYIPFSD